MIINVSILFGKMVVKQVNVNGFLWQIGVIVFIWGSYITCHRRVVIVVIFNRMLRLVYGSDSCLVHNLALFKVANGGFTFHITHGTLLLIVIRCYWTQLLVGIISVTALMLNCVLASIIYLLGLQML